MPSACKLWMEYSIARPIFRRRHLTCCMPLLLQAAGTSQPNTASQPPAASGIFAEVGHSCDRLCFGPQFADCTHVATHQPAGGRPSWRAGCCQHISSNRTSAAAVHALGAFIGQRLLTVAPPTVCWQEDEEDDGFDEDVVMTLGDWTVERQRLQSQGSGGLPPCTPGAGGTAFRAMSRNSGSFCGIQEQLLAPSFFPVRMRSCMRNFALSAATCSWKGNEDVIPFGTGRDSYESAASHSEEAASLAAPQQPLGGTLPQGAGAPGSAAQHAPLPCQTGPQQPPAQVNWPGRYQLRVLWLHRSLISGSVRI